MTTDATTRTRTITWDDPMATASAAAGRTGLQFVQALAAGEVPAPPIMNLTGAQLVSAESGRVVFSLEPAEYHYNPIGSVHGGIIATLLDSAAGCAVQTMLEEGVGYTSLDLSVKYLRGIRADTGLITCTGSVVHAGRRTALAQAEIRDGNDRLLASATSSCVILRP
ncbi:PaaI family thioesterase [Williamsia maris]|uniref:Domain 1-containing protein n=1 Tax=Williamsia maris TaxID=72806 RepID=A0ABT1HCX4_9NOCA|nr:PaaI family thioesterase [Williamsia maris]MCP2175565.1 putative domain 1-containing protein [Williamsia maris]